MSAHPSHPEIIMRLRRAEGHLRSIVSMLEKGRDRLAIAQHGLQHHDLDLRSAYFHVVAAAATSVLASWPGSTACFRAGTG
ncbi:MAG TPA: metal-sensing transcriptional repressor [Accumulibacter sp.]|nr:metal-sensing transcriptional repressor [Accumulibacter sp.]